MTSQLRPEIAGLRAIAVLGVVLFHLKIPGFSGGFAGVDIFFVISGYLITRNILSDLDARDFSFANFYIRRMRRIFPALIVTVLVTYIVAALWCSPLMFLDIAKEATHALLSIANIQYWRESHQYFAPNSDELALLHCWSLSLEEQFYLAWPLFIVAARKYGITFGAVAVASLASLLASIVVSRTDASAVFFLTPFRIYEFGCGAVLLVVEPRVKLGPAAANILSGAGVASVVVSVLMLRSDMPYPAIATLLPCLGAAATILAGGQTFASRLLVVRPMTAVGAISYSLYLVHWPIIFFARFIVGDGVDAAIGAMVLLASMLVVASAIHVLVERRFIQTRGEPGPSLAKNAAVFAAVMLPLVALTHLTFLQRGFLWRLPAARLQTLHLQEFPGNADLGGTEGPVGVQFLGDSLIGQYAYGMKPIMRELHLDYQAAGGPGCPILYRVTASNPARREFCRAARDHALEQIGRNTLPVVYTQLWRLYDDAAIDVDTSEAAALPPLAGSYKKLQLALRPTIEKLVAEGHRVLLVGAQVDPGCPIDQPRLLPGPLPHAPQAPCPVISRSTADQSVTPIDQVLAGVRDSWPDRVALLRPVDYFCDAACPVTRDGLWLYTSRIHLSLAGSDYMVSRSRDALLRFFRNDRS
jgi:peptidoglycan/LPS O-acetylase OafA/YrhL